MDSILLAQALYFFGLARPDLADQSISPTLFIGTLEAPLNLYFLWKKNTLNLYLIFEKVKFYILLKKEN